jgi:hypothetical protein
MPAFHEQLMKKVYQQNLPNQTASIQANLASDAGIFALVPYFPFPYRADHDETAESYHMT